MKKNIIFCLCLFSINIFAQKKVQTGIKAGLQICRFQGIDFNWSPENPASSRAPERLSTKTLPVLGYTVGGYIRTLEPTFLQAEIMLSVKGAQIDQFLGNNTTKTSTTTIQYTQIDIPLSIGHQFNKIEIGGGPMISVNVAENGKLKTLLAQYSASPPQFSPFQTLTAGFHFGVGYRLTDKLTANLRYMGSIQNVTAQSIYFDDPTLAVGQRESSFKQRSGVWQLTVGYKL
jgi:Outer membrane protein beta-barrel domain